MCTDSGDNSASYRKGCATTALSMGMSCGTACLSVLVEHARINRRRKEIVGSSDRVDVACQVQVHLLHWNDLHSKPRCAILLFPQLGSLTLW